MELRVVYIAIPTLDLRAMAQRYTRLDATTVRYELRDGQAIVRELVHPDSAC